MFAGKSKAFSISEALKPRAQSVGQFEKDGQIINAVYGDDGPDLKVGDEVDIVWPGLYTRLPHVMSQEIYDRSMQIEATQQNDNAI